MTEIFIVAFLILLNGLFALSELAVVSARHPRLKALAAAGRGGAEQALALASDPGRFLSAVQIGITLIGILNGAYSGETFGEHAAQALRGWGISNAIADPLGYGAVIFVITYLSVIVGELVPKTLALRNAEAIACTVAPTMALFATAASPVVWLLDASTRLVFRIFGQADESQQRITDEEIRTLIADAETAGVIATGERKMISGVMRLADRGVAGIMTPRPDVDWIDLSASQDEIVERLIATPHSRLPVGNGSIDMLVGVVQTRDLLAATLRGAPLDLALHVHKAPIVPETTGALDVLSILKSAEIPIALIHDEYGHFEGLVTPADILEAIVGAFRSDVGDDGPHAVERADGTWLLSGAMPVDEMAETTGIQLPDRRSYETVAGFVLQHLQRLPQTGEWVETNGWRFEVVDLDGRRIDKVLASRVISPRRSAH